MSVDALLPKSLASRLVFYNVATFYTLLLVAFLFLYWAIAAVLQSRSDSEFKDDIIEFSEILKESGTEGVIEEMNNETFLEHDNSFFILLKSPDEVIHETKMDYWQNFKPGSTISLTSVSESGNAIFETRYFERSDSNARIVYAPLSSNYMLIMAESTEDRDDIMQLLAIAFFCVFLLTLPTASIMVLGITRRAISGIYAVQHAALDLESGDLSRRVRMNDQVKEVQTLADSFDSMADRIQQLVTEMREMTDNISHDLRTPIGRIRLLVESIAKNDATASSSVSVNETRKNTQIAISECDRLINMINTSLDVSETEAGVVHYAPLNIDMHELLTDACDLFETLAEEKRISVEREFAVDSFVTGQLNSLQRMVANLLDNAVKYTGYGGVIAVQTLHSNGQLNIHISNTGFVIDESNYENIFNRFFQIEPSRSSDGCGLGLSYSRAVARSMGGDITISSDQVNRNTFIITLPLSELAQTG